MEKVLNDQRPRVADVLAGQLALAIRKHGAAVTQCLGSGVHLVSTEMP